MRRGEREREGKKLVAFFSFFPLSVSSCSLAFVKKRNPKNIANSGDPFEFTLGAGQVIKGKVFFCLFLRE